MDPLELFARCGLGIVATAVLLQQAGVPIPAATVLVAAGALSNREGIAPEHILSVAVTAALLADHVWFLLGRRHGRPLLRLACRVSISPDSCVTRTDELLVRHGPGLLAFAKFMPGISAVAIPTASATGLPYARFLIFDTLGCLLWSGAYLSAGLIFSHEVNRVLSALRMVGAWAVAAMGTLLAAYVGAKVLRRRRLIRLHRAVRVTAHELQQMLIVDDGVVILDARSKIARQDDLRRLPRAIDVSVDGALPDLPASATLVTFCTCPNEASAAVLADRLFKAGYARVHVLSGGEQALQALSIDAVHVLAAAP